MREFKHCLHLLSFRIYCKGFKFIFRRYHFHSFKASKSQLNIRSAPGVTILKPLKFCQSSSGDLRTLRANLESFFQIKYPKFEVFFCVREADDSSVEIVRKLIQEYPKVKAELKIGKNFYNIFITEIHLYFLPFYIIS